jgi:hypothetical protein
MPAMDIQVVLKGITDAKESSVMEEDQKAETNRSVRISDHLRERFPIDLRLIQNPAERACRKFRVQGYDAAYGAGISYTLQNNVAAPLSHPHKPKLFKGANSCRP